MGPVESNVTRVRERIAAACRRAGRAPEGVQLVVVTKYADASVLPCLKKAGVSALGESRVQDALKKPAEDFDWHMIGHLQTNKAGKAIERFSTVHSLDREALAEELQKRLLAASRTIDAYVQVNVSGESTKHGAPPDGASRLIDYVREKCRSIRLRGLMTMAPDDADAEASRPHFRRLRDLARAAGIDGLSMGMSQDFEAAIEEGATLVRVGRAIVSEAVGCRS